jgi:hypothetical protein
MTTSEFIEFIENNQLPCLIWNFGNCPLKEIADLAPELSIEKNGDIISAIRCYVVLHKPGIGDDLIPQNMIEEFERFSIHDGYQITIPIIYSAFDQSVD